MTMAKRGLGLGSNNKQKKCVSRYLACEPFDHSRDERETKVSTAKEFFFKNSEINSDCVAVAPLASREFNEVDENKLKIVQCR